MNQSYTGGGFSAAQPRTVNGSSAALDEINNSMPAQTAQMRPTTFSYTAPTASPWTTGTAQTMPSITPAQPAQQNVFPQTITLRLAPEISQEAVESPVTSQEAFEGSMKALLGRNIGHYVVASFLVGTQDPVSWEGFLHSVGNDYITIFQPDQGRYVTCDLYSLKFVEFHDQKGVVPACAGYRRRDAAPIW